MSTRVRAFHFLFGAGTVALRRVLVFLPIMVSRCVCFDVTFEQLKKIALEHDVQSVDELHTHVVFGEKCGLCLPFVAQMLKSGAIEFEIGFDSDFDDSNEQKSAA